MEIFVDADACPVKQEVMTVANRHGLPVTMVSNQGTRPLGANMKSILVGPEFDAADNWIIDHLSAGDIVITTDIQLAARALEKAAMALAPTGRAFTKENIGSALAMRELSSYLREVGEIKGNNPGFSKKDRSEFLQALEGMIQRG